MRRVGKKGTSLETFGFEDKGNRGPNSIVVLDELRRESKVVV